MRTQVGRRKGEIISRHVLEQYRYQVRVKRAAVAGRVWPIIDAWLETRGWNRRHVSEFGPGASLDIGDRELVRYCFESREQADAFVTEFGGERIDYMLKLTAFEIQPEQAGPARPCYYRLHPSRCEGE